MPFVQANSLKVHYQQKGSGPDLVLMHAFTSNSSMWMFTNIQDALSTDFRVTCYDLRGHGATSVTPTGYTSAEMANDFLALHEALDLGPCVLVGHSFGGVIGIHTAIKRPGLVRGVIFSDTYLPGLRQLEPNMGQAEPWLDLQTQLSRCGNEIGESVDFSKLFRAIRGMNESQRQQLNEEMGVFGANWISRLGALAETTAGVDSFLESGLTAQAIAGVQCPVLALYDEFSPFHKTREFLESRLPNVRSEIVPGARHLAPIQSTDAFLSLVGEGALQFTQDSATLTSDPS